MLALIGTASPAASYDLEEYLGGAAVAEYSGRRIAMTLFDGESQAGIFELTHASQMVVVGSGKEGALIGPGRVSGDTGVMVPVWSQYAKDDRYRILNAEPTMRLGRMAEVLEVLEDDLVRARFTFDSLTRIPLVTEIYNSDGTLFRYSAMIEINAKPDLSYADMEAMSDSYDVMFPVGNTSMPLDAAGYVRADTYTGPDGTVQAFYTDSLFSFSLFEVDVDAHLDRFENAPTIKMNGETYSRIVTPTDIWMSWKSGDVAYVLIGDLPPDHLVKVLDDLPRPKQRGLFSRLWRSIFD